MDLEDTLDMEAMLSQPVHQPEMRTVETELLRSALTAVEAGIGWAESVLFDHDRSLGRKTRKNKQAAESIELDIRQMKATESKLRDALGWTA